MIAESAVIKILLDALKAAFRQLGKRSSRKRHAELLSGAIAEMLREHPDISAIEAKLAAAELTGQPPDSDLFRAKKLLGKSKSWQSAKPSSAKLTILNQGSSADKKSVSASKFFARPPKQRKKTTATPKKLKSPGRARARHKMP